ncbi:MAG: hypothetical protein MIO92_12555 [Methanosarcinaceae archaeon]|nr:hypothetical protein [Methanosarcinaceae archaeon]
MGKNLTVVVSEGIAVSDQPKVVRDERFSEPYEVGRGAEIYIRQKPYWISYSKFLILNGHYTRSKLISLARWILGPTIGWGITIIAKAIANSDVKIWEWIMLAIGLLGSGSLYGICHYITDSKKDLMSNIEKHFKEHEEELFMDNQNE